MIKMTIEFKFENGDEVKDIVTGLQGIVIYQINYLNGCKQYGIKREMKKNDKEPADAVGIDEEQLKLIKAKKIVTKYIPSGGDMTDTPGEFNIK